MGLFDSGESSADKHDIQPVAAKRTARWSVQQVLSGIIFEWSKVFQRYKVTAEIWVYMTVVEARRISHSRYGRTVCCWVDGEERGGEERRKGKEEERKRKKKGEEERGEIRSRRERKKEKREGGRGEEEERRRGGKKKKKKDKLKKSGLMVREKLSVCFARHRFAC